MALNKSEVVAAVAAKTGQSQTAVAAAIDALFDVVAAEVGRDGGKVTIPGFISFERTRRAARAGRNPQTGATIQIAASNAVKVSAGSKLKAAAK
ncbi:MAG: integration host factor [Actinobacteria bacterium]|jgi:DNA-binding protein HU-beta|uniref:Unannotated protein n=1 Tax=freshwater metagenome TaxID=449393 RepID=A0A6J7F3C9_9ZZZZ|nr:integration host factor [Actinomycetota bacterium]